MLVSVYCLYTLTWLIRSLVDPTLAELIVCGPLQLFSLFLDRPAETGPESLETGTHFRIVNILRTDAHRSDHRTEFPTCIESTMYEIIDRARNDHMDEFEYE